MISRRGFLGGAGVGLAGLAGLACQTRPPRRRDSETREVARVVPAIATRDGAGVSLRRSLGTRELPHLDPFLLLDEIHSDRQEDWIAGFPTHPHRGFETVSILISGAFEHRDSAGNHGVIGDGGIQWMTAGRGIVHSEMPRQEPGLDLWGLQLWVNLPAARKMGRPRYQDLDASAIPTLDLGDARARVIAGAIGARRGPVEEIAVEPTLIDATVPAGAGLHHELPAGHTAFVYVLSGTIAVGARAVRANAGELAILEHGREVSMASDEGARLLLFAAAPIGEPVARRGPFVMNTEAELEQAFADYRNGRLTD